MPGYLTAGLEGRRSPKPWTGLNGVEVKHVATTRQLMHELGGCCPTVGTQIDSALRGRNRWEHVEEEGFGWCCPVRDHLGASCASLMPVLDEPGIAVAGCSPTFYHAARRFLRHDQVIVGKNALGLVRLLGLAFEEVYHSPPHVSAGETDVHVVPVADRDLVPPVHIDDHVQRLTQRQIIGQDHQLLRLLVAAERERQDADFFAGETRNGAERFPERLIGLHAIGKRGSDRAAEYA